MVDYSEIKIVAIVRVIVENSRGQILILQRPPGCTGGGKWCLPGGKIDPTETIEEAAMRELFEETRLSAREPVFLLATISPIVDAKQYAHSYLKCRSDDHPALNEESAASAWIEEKDLGAFDIAFGDDVALARFWHKDGQAQDHL